MSSPVVFLPPWAILGLAVLLLFWYYVHQKYYTYFKRHQVPGHRWPIFPFGDVAGVTLHRRNYYDMMTDSYNKFRNHGFFGIYDLCTPIICIRDPVLIQRVTLQDFDHFADHQQRLLDASHEPMIGRSLLTLSGDKWRDMRTTLAPALAGGRIADMFQLVASTARRAVDELHRSERVSRTRTYPRLRDVLERFVTDGTASLTFGIETNSFDDRNNRFYRIAQQALDFYSWQRVLKVIAIKLLYKLSAPVQLRYYTSEVVEYFSKLVLDTIADRQVNNSRRPDIVQALLDAQLRFADREQMATLAYDELGSEDMCGVRRRQWDSEELIAQCFMLFMTGHETVTQTLVFLVYELMMAQDVQRRLTDEIDALRRAGDENRPLEYRDLDRLTYMDMVIAETMRKWPIGFRLRRKCVKEYRLIDQQGNTLTIHPGDTIWIPIIGLHMDPHYFADPHRFDPERFSAERKNLIRPFTYLPYGAGPRSCIGSKFGVMQIKVFLYHLLSAFMLDRTPTTRPLQLTVRRTGVIRIKDFDVRLTPRA